MAALPRALLRLLLGLLLLVTPLPSSSSSLGINYGQVANNLPSPEAVIPLLRSIGVSRVKIYDADPTVLHAFAGSGVEFVVGLADECVVKVRDAGEALTWVKTNIAPFVAHTKISAITVGNEVLTGNNSGLIHSLLPAMQSIHSALAACGLDQQVAVTTPHSLAVLETSYPPSAGAFRKDLAPYICEILYFLEKTGAPFLINAYPFFAYKADPKRVSLDYVLFQPNAGVLDPATGLRYGNMLHAQVDAVHTAIDRLMGKGKGFEVKVSETGWPSNGDSGETGATAENAKKYNSNLARLVSQKMGTPLRPNSTLQVYIFALFNENMKPGPGSERNYGLFKPDGTPAYDIGIRTSATKGGGSGEGDGGAAAGGDGGAYPSSSSGFYAISAATKVE
ncbi:unnamed protein product [Spirodela intermedia]|uniref:glucan endo-1,3-beta-D-glucosidase n=1 Tax=Spirodela intermedia TaxID=51605 RepID=A0A7I8LKY1_SPIIN|nr:unnamed protein product [Spirodela intermedia]